MSGHALKDVEGFVKRGKESFNVDPRVLVVKDGGSGREKIGTDAEDQSLKEFIRENGSLALPPLLVQKQPDKTLLIRNGHRRRWACLELIKEGVDIRAVPVQLTDKNMTDEEALFLVFTSNAGKPLSPFEEAQTFKRLKNCGYEVDEIAKRIGRSIQFVYKRLQLANATLETRQAVESGKVGVSTATNAVSSSGGDEGRQRKAIKQASQRKKSLRVVFDRRSDCFKQKGKATDRQNELIGNIFTDELLGDLEEAGLDPETIKFSILPKNDI